MVVYFSGLGNTAWCAEQLGKLLNESLVKLPYEGSTLSVAPDGRVIWMFPVYSWGIPPMVAKWIAELPLEGGERAKHFAVMTCGDDMGYADRTWRKAIEARGWRGLQAYSVQMPNTYVTLPGFDVDKVAVAQLKVEAAPARLRRIADSIQGSGHEQMPWMLVRGAFPWLKTYVIRPWFLRHAMSPKPFHATDACTGCGRCARACPTQNITMADHRPCWGDNCAFCLRCYHICPHHAVAYGSATRSKGQYLCTMRNA